MAEDEEGQVGLGGIKAPDYLRPQYANYVNVSHTPWDFRLTFALVRAPTPGDEQQSVAQAGAIHPEAVADLIIPANIIHGLIGALQESFGKYLDSYGVPGLGMGDQDGPQEGQDE